MTSVIESGGSLDSAVRLISDEGPPCSAELFSEVVRRADTKADRGVREALVSVLGTLPREANGFRQAMLLCISASESGDRDERRAVLSEASEVSLDAVRLMGERYSASLAAPCMVVYSLCILAPLVLMTVLPVMGIGGMFGSVPVDQGFLSALMLAVIPAAVVAICIWLRRTNPFAHDSSPFRPSILLPFLAAIPVFLAASAAGKGAEMSVMLSASTAALMSVILLSGDRRREKARAGAEAGMMDGVYEIGSSMLSGEIFEDAVIGAMSTRPECAGQALSLQRELEICRGDADSALKSSIGPVSREVSRVLCDIHRCSLKDPDDAGRLAASVGRQFQSRADVMSGLELKLKSMTDMMAGTAMIFAPMVLGMSISLLGPLSGLTGYDGGDTGTVISVYLIELCAMIALMTTSLGTDRSIESAVYRFSAMLPISMIVFALCSSVSLRGGLIIAEAADTAAWTRAGGFCSQPQPSLHCSRRRFSPLRTPHPMGPSGSTAGIPDSSRAGGPGAGPQESHTRSAICYATSSTAGASSSTARSCRCASAIPES